MKVKDGGFGWVVMIAAFVLQGISCGLSFSVGVVIIEWLEHFGGRHDVVAWVGSLNSGLMFAAGPVAGALVNRFGHRSLCMIGGLMAAIGLFTSSFADNFYTLYVTYGILSGVGFGFMYVPAAVICGIYFEKYRAIAFGVCASGVGVFCVVLPPVLRLLVEEFGWRGSMIILAGLCVQSCVFAMLLLPEEFWQNQESNSKQPKNICESADQNQILNHDIQTCSIGHTNNMPQPFLGKTIVCHLNFVLLSLSCFLWNFGSLVLIVLITDYAVTSGQSKDEAAWCLSAIGFAGIIGRLSSGIFANCNCTNTLLFYNIVTTFSGLCIATVALDSQFWYLLLCCCGYGYCFGSQVGVLALTITELFGVENLTFAYGYNIVFHGLGAVSGPPVAGAIYEWTWNYPTVFLVGGVVTMFGGFAGFMIQIKDRCKSNHQQHYLDNIFIENHIYPCSNE